MKGQGKELSYLNALQTHSREAGSWPVTEALPEQLHCQDPGCGGLLKVACVPFSTLGASRAPSAPQPSDLSREACPGPGESGHFLNPRETWSPLYFVFFFFSF